MAAENEYKPRTAQDNAADLGPLQSDLENAKRAEEEGVLDVAYVGYEEALKNYESRSDVETLEQRLAREVGGSFETAHFARERGVLLGRDDKQLEVEKDPVKAKQASAKRAEESDQWKRDQASHTGDETEEYNEPVKANLDDGDDDKKSSSKK